VSLVVSCNHCHAVGVTDDYSFPDAAVTCASPADDPPGSVEGSCSTAGHTHEEHLAHVRATGDASNRPLTITVTGTTVTPAG
jgi:hypothetical protein